MELNVQEWKEFKVGRLFRLEPTKGILSDDLIEGKDIPYIGAKHDTNGYMMMCKREDFENWISEGNCIVFIQLGAGSAGYVNYLPTDFIGMNGKTICGYIDGVLNSYIGLFLETILCQERPKYSFGRSWTGDRLKETKIALPIKYNSNKTPYIDKSRTYSDEGFVPDWQFMEDYIKSLHHKPITTKVKAANVKELDIDNWEEFKVSDLFKLVHGKANDGMLEEGTDCVYLGAKLNDCGFMRRCKFNEQLAHEGNCVCFVTNGEGSVGYAFYKGLEDKFIATIDLVMGYADFLTPAIGNFIATCLCLERGKYSHGRKWKKTLPTTMIKLPIQRDSNGNPIIDENCTYSDRGYIPDWQFMEDYINSLPYSDRI